jgi:hypothetical protein
VDAIRIASLIIDSGTARHVRGARIESDREVSTNRSPRSDESTLKDIALDDAVSRWAPQSVIVIQAVRRRGVA